MEHHNQAKRNRPSSGGDGKDYIPPAAVGRGHRGRQFEPEKMPPGPRDYPNSGPRGYPNSGPRDCPNSDPGDHPSSGPNDRISPKRSRFDGERQDYNPANQSSCGSQDGDEEEQAENDQGREQEHELQPFLPKSSKEKIVSRVDDLVEQYMAAKKETFDVINKIKDEIRETFEDFVHQLDATSGSQMAKMDQEMNQLCSDIELNADEIDEKEDAIRRVMQKLDKLGQQMKQNYSSN